MYLKSTLIIATIIFLISCGETSQNIAMDETYGILRVPILAECQIDSKELEITPINRVELVRFDMNVSGSNVNSYLHIEHTGLPSVVLAKVHNSIGNCLPITVVKYDNSEMLALDLDIFESVSLTNTVYIKAEKGKFEVRYQKSNVFN